MREINKVLLISNIMNLTIVLIISIIATIFYLIH